MPLTHEWPSVMSTAFPQVYVVARPPVEGWYNTPPSANYSTAPRLKEARQSARQHPRIPTMTKGVAIITGSSQGLGKAMAMRLSRDGFAVIINDVASKQAQIDAVASEIDASGGRALGIAADVTKRSEVQALVDEATEQLDLPLQVMVANAGLGHANGIFDMTEEHVQQILDVNVAGVFNCFAVAGKKMVEQQKGGKLVAASSIAAFKPMSFVSAYTASKWAVRGLVQVRQFGRDRIYDKVDVQVSAD